MCRQDKDALADTIEALHAVADSLLSYILPLAEGGCLWNFMGFASGHTIECPGVRYFESMPPCAAARSACQAGACAACAVCPGTNATIAAGCWTGCKCDKHAESCRIGASTACARCAHALSQVLHLPFP